MSTVHGAVRIYGALSGIELVEGATYTLQVRGALPAVEGDVLALPAADIVSATRLSTAVGEGDTLAYALAQEEETALSFTAVVTWQSTQTRTARDTKKRVLHVLDDSVSTPVELVAFSDAADLEYEPGSVFCFKRVKTAPNRDGSGRSLRVLDRPMAASNARLRALYEGVRERATVTVRQLLDVEVNARVKLRVIVLRARREDIHDNSNGTKRAIVEFVDASGFRVSCTLFDRALEVPLVEGTVVELRDAKLTERNFSRRLTLDDLSIIETNISDAALEEWWATNYWHDFALLPAKENAREGVPVPLASVTSLAPNTRVDVEGTLVESGDAWFLTDGEMRLPLKVLRRGARALTAGAHVLIKQAVRNRGGDGLTVFEDTPVVMLE